MVTLVSASGTSKVRRPNGPGGPGFSLEPSGPQQNTGLRVGRNEHGGSSDDFICCWLVVCLC